MREILSDDEQGNAEDVAAFHVFRHNYGTWMQLYAGLDDIGLTRTGAMSALWILFGVPALRPPVLGWALVGTEHAELSIDLCCRLKHPKRIPGLTAEARRAALLPTPKRAGDVRSKKKVR